MMNTAPSPNLGNKSIDTTNPNPTKTQWSELEEFGKNGFPDTTGSTPKPVTSETPDQKQARIDRAAQDVRDAYKTQAPPVTTPTAEDSMQNLYAKYLSPTPTQESQPLSHAPTARSRVETIKSNLYPGSPLIQDYESKQISTPPSAPRKAARAIMDKLGIHSKRSEERRDREAMATALQEYYAEQEALQAAAIEQENLQRAEEEDRRRKEAEHERKLLELGMANARNYFDTHRSERLRNQRSQEIVEQDLNSRLLSIEDLETEIASDNSEVSKRSVAYEGAEIPVYDLKGIPFSLLAHTVDYRKANKPGDIGTETYKAVMADPSIWAERQDEAEKSSGFGTRGSNARGDTISAYYYNSERNLSSYIKGNLIYGFAHVDGDSIISVHNGDGGTSNVAGKAETSLSNLSAIDDLEGAEGTNLHNEVLLRRYSETGTAKSPDYIIAENGNISETALRHAKFFNIPIINIETKKYIDKQRERGQEIINSISETDSYKTLDQKLTDLLSLSEYKTQYHTIQEVGRNPAILPRYATPTMEKCFEISQLELAKRLDLIKNKLEEATSNIENATQNGQPAPENPEGFDYFNVYIQDAQNGYRRHANEDYVDNSLNAPGNCNHIYVDFKLQNSPHYIKTTISDGERLTHPEDYLYLEQDTRNADSSYYDALEPIVLKYFDAYRKNHAQAKNP